MKTADALSIIESNPEHFEYGSTFSPALFRQMFSIVIMSDREFKRFASELSRESLEKKIEQDKLQEVGIASTVRDILHGHGKHFYMNNGNYRIALPSENEQKAIDYRNRATRNLRRAKKLSMNTPVLVSGHKDTSKSLDFMFESHGRARY